MATPPFLDKPPILPNPPFLAKIFRPPSISINFEKVEPPPLYEGGGGRGPNYVCLKYTSHVVFSVRAWIPPALIKHVTCCLRDDLLTLFFFSFLNVIFPKFLGNTLIMSHYWYFWKFAPHPCKESGVPTMLVVLSSPLLIISFLLSIPPFLKCVIHTGKLQQLIS